MWQRFDKKFELSGIFYLTMFELSMPDLYDLVKILPNHLPNLNHFFIKCLQIFKPNTILATLPEWSILGKTRA